LNEFKRASDDFKRTWEREVAIESVEREAAIDRAMVAEPEPAQFSTNERGAVAEEAAPHDITNAAFAPVQGANIARGARVETPAPAVAAGETTDADEPETATIDQQQSSSSSRKTDWL
jgi:hypothetical protein